MRYHEISKSKSRIKNYAVKLQLKSLGYTQQVDTMISATSPEMARRILRKQYNNSNVIVGQPREIKSR